MGAPARLEVDGGVGIVRLDRPPANAIDLEMGLALGDAIREAEGRDDVGAVVVWGGERIFAAGADIAAMAEWGPDEVRPSVDALADACDLLEAMPKPAIAAVNGYALGGGLELALACDLRYLAEDAQVGQPEVRIGVIPGAGATQRLVPLVGAGRARDLVYTGRRVDADEALRIGLAERVLPPGEVLPAAVGDARELAEGPRDALAAAKRAIRAASGPGREGVALERELFLGLFGTPDQREGMRAFLEKRPPRFGRRP
jgi:enoyl-CoA hydratase/carnithine racemase